MEIIIVRHTQTVASSGICYGQTDLQPASEDDMLRVAEKLSVYPNPIVYSSPLQRCRLLAEKVSENIRFDSRLMELNFGRWEMQHWNQLHGPEVDAWMNDFVNVRCPEGESFAEMATRVMAFWNSLEQTTHPVIMVTHGGVIRIILASIKGIPLKDSFELEVDYGQLFCVDVD